MLRVREGKRDEWREGTELRGPTRSTEGETERPKQNSATVEMTECRRPAVKIEKSRGERPAAGAVFQAGRFIAACHELYRWRCRLPVATAAARTGGPGGGGGEGVPRAEARQVDHIGTSTETGKLVDYRGNRSGRVGLGQEVRLGQVTSTSGRFGSGWWSGSGMVEDRGRGRGTNWGWDLSRVSADL